MHKLTHKNKDETKQNSFEASQPSGNFAAILGKQAKK